MRNVAAKPLGAHSQGSLIERVMIVPVFPGRNDDAAKVALVKAGAILTTILAAALLTACAKVDAVDQNDNAAILIDDPVYIPATEPIITTNDAASNSVTNEVTNQVEEGDNSR